MKKCSYCGAEYSNDAVECAVDHTPLNIPPSSVEIPPSSVERKHSGIGIASFGISIVVGCLMVTALGIASFLSAHRIEGERTYPGQMIVGFAIIFLLAADVVAVGLGIAAVCQTVRQRVLGILGLVFSGLTIIGTVGLMIIGLVYLSRLAR